MKRLIEVFAMIAITYTLISISNAILVIIRPSYTYSPENSILTLVFCGVGVLVLYSHHLFKNLSPLSMIILQYIIAIVTILLIIKVTGIWLPLHDHAYRDGLRSFSLPYFIGAVIYYLHLYLEIKKHNRWIESIKKTKEF